MTPQEIKQRLGDSIITEIARFSIMELGEMFPPRAILQGVLLAMLQDLNDADLEDAGYPELSAHHEAPSPPTPEENT